MKTIRERAREYAESEDLVQGTDGFEYCLRDYIKGATDQKAIEFERWLKVARNVLTEDSLEAFRKAMEE